MDEAETVPAAPGAAAHDPAGRPDHQEGRPGDRACADLQGADPAAEGEDHRCRDRGGEHAPRIGVLIFPARIDW
jgi:hypothetical protein